MWRKFTISGLLLVVALLLLCTLRILPNIPVLMEYGIYCDCQEIVNSNKDRFEAVNDTIVALSNDTNHLRKRIDELQKQLAIVNSKYEMAIHGRDSLQNLISGYQNEINNLKSQLEMTNNSLKSAIKERDSLKVVLSESNQAWQDSISKFDYIKRQNDSLIKMNIILQNVHIINLKAYTSRNFIFDKVKVNQINIKYCMSGMSHLKEHMEETSARVFFKIKTKDGNYKMRGERAGSTDIEDHYRLYDVIIYNKLNSNQFVATAVYPNWQTPFNIFDKYTIEAYIILNETEVLLGSVTQDLKIKERTYSLDEMD